MCVAATLDGGLGYVLPVPEKTYRRLLMLQNVLVNHTAHTGGLNPKAFRWGDYSTKMFIIFWSSYSQWPLKILALACSVHCYFTVCQCTIPTSCCCQHWTTDFTVHLFHHTWTLYTTSSSFNMLSASKSVPLTSYNLRRTLTYFKIIIFKRLFFDNGETLPALFSVIQTLFGYHIFHNQETGLCFTELLMIFLGCNSELPKFHMEQMHVIHCCETHSNAVCSQPYFLGSFIFCCCCSFKFHTFQNP